MSGYDIIGDIHGHAAELEALLKAMGYTRQQGTLQHSERQALFVGDFIDRGPEQLRSVDIVRRMVDAGSAQAVMGNHEFNAIAWYLRGEHGQPLREHSDKNRHQHSKFLADVVEGSVRHREHIDWFLSLPLWLELDEINIIHACWHQDYMARFADKLIPGHRLSDELMQEAARVPDDASHITLFHAIEAWLKGVEIPLPDGIAFKDKDGHERRHARLKWWRDTPVDFFDALVGAKEDLHQALCGHVLPAENRLIYNHPNPVFFGHYWMSGEPIVDNRRAICVDYSVANGGRLVAYRWGGDGPAHPKKMFFLTRRVGE